MLPFHLYINQSKHFPGDKRFGTVDDTSCLPHPDSMVGLTVSEDPVVLSQILCVPGMHLHSVLSLSVAPTGKVQISAGWLPPW